MFPIRDDVPSRSFPFVTVGIIIVNAIVFLFEISLGRLELRLLMDTYGFVPYKVTAYGAGYSLTAREVFLPAFTAIFLHGGWMHLIGNMWYLWIFGDNVEDRLGHLRFLIFYIMCGLIGNLGHYVFNHASQMPAIGASGAIAGVLGAYVISYPAARILVLVPLFFFLQFIELPAVIVLGFWFVIQFFQGVGALLAPRWLAGVAWWAHIAGFTGGILIFKMFRPRPRIFYRRRRFSFYDDFDI